MQKILQDIPIGRNIQTARQGERKISRSKE